MTELTSFTQERLTFLDDEMRALDYAIEAAAQPFADYIADDISMLRNFDEDDVPDYVKQHPTWAYRENNTYAFYGTRQRIGEIVRWRDNRYDDIFDVPLAFVVDREQWKAKYEQACLVYAANEQSHTTVQHQQTVARAHAQQAHEQREYTRLHAKYGDRSCA